MSAKELLKQYEVEINKHDFDIIEPLISKDCKFWFSSGTYTGINEARAAFEKTWSLIKEEVYSISNLEWITESETTASCTYTFHWHGIIDDKPSQGTGRGTSCLAIEEGQWKIIHEHLSHFPS